MTLVNHKLIASSEGGACPRADPDPRLENALRVHYRCRDGRSDPTNTRGASTPAMRRAREEMMVGLILWWWSS